MNKCEQWSDADVNAGKWARPLYRLQLSMKLLFSLAFDAIVMAGNIIPNNIIPNNIIPNTITWLTNFLFIENI